MTVLQGGGIESKCSNAVLREPKARTNRNYQFPAISFLEAQKRNVINVFISNVRRQHKSGQSVVRLLPH